MDLNVNFIKSVLTLYDEMLNNGISLVYLGEFNHQITKMFTSMSETEMEKKNEERQTIKKVYHVLVETLQNMSKHSDEISDNNNIGSGLFIIGKKEDTYYVITSNKVSKKKKERLESVLHIINSSTREELKEMYKKQLVEGHLTEKGGAGLGLIDIVRKANKKLHFQFLPMESDDYFFILKVEINVQQIRDAEIN